MYYYRRWRQYRAGQHYCASGEGAEVMLVDYCQDKLTEAVQSLGGESENTLSLTDMRHHNPKML